MSKLKYKNGRLAQVGDMIVHPSLGHQAEVKQLNHDRGGAPPNATVEHQDNHLNYAADITEWLHQEDAPKPAPVKAEPKIDEAKTADAGPKGQAPQRAPASNEKA